ncbi:hypothetical protein D3C83_31020 [compost metagenome]
MEHAGVRERTVDVELRQALVKTDGGGEALDQIGDRLAETPRPRLGTTGRRPLFVGRHGAC